MVKVKVFFDSDEKPLEEEINTFLGENNVKLIDIKYAVAIGEGGSGATTELISAMVVYQ